MQVYTPRPREMALEYIEAYILENNLQEHDKLPPERDMCALWGLNRSTLRSAIARLVAEGRLYTRKGSGIRVSPRVTRTLQDLKGFAEYARGQGMTPESRLLSFTLVEADKQLARRFRREEGAGLYRIARLRLLNGIPVLIETAYIPQALAPGLQEHDLVHGSLFDTLKYSYGLSIDHGWQKASITSATPDEASYLEIAEGAPAFWIVSETYGEDGTLIEYCRSLGRADVMDMKSTLYWREGNDG